MRENTFEDMNMKETIEQLLGEVIQINKKHEEIDKLTGKSFNIFEAGGVGHKEVFHTKLIAELLYPQSNHMQKDKFLQIFLKQIGIKEKLQLPQVYAEYLIDNDRRIDIVIEDNDFVIAIEAKVYASDQQNQLYDYYQYIKTMGKKRFYLFYLTLFGNEASSESLQDLEIENYQTISFQVDILQWLQECIKIVAQIPHLREGLLQYEDLIQKLTNTNTQQGEEIMEVMMKNPTTMKAANEIAHHYKDAWFKKEYDFWLELYNKVEKEFEGFEDADEEIYKLWYKNGELLGTDDVIANMKKTKQRGICFKNDIMQIGIEFDAKNDGLYKWYKLAQGNIELDGYEKWEKFGYFYKLCETQIGLYGASELTYDLYDKNFFDKYVKLIAKELLQLKGFW